MVLTVSSSSVSIDHMVGATTTSYDVIDSCAKAQTAVQPGSLATVATSGQYSDLTGAPAVPTSADYVDLTSNQTAAGNKTWTGANTFQSVPKVRTSAGGSIGFKQTATVNEGFVGMDIDSTYPRLYGCVGTQSKQYIYVDGNNGEGNGVCLYADTSGAKRDLGKRGYPWKNIYANAISSGSKSISVSTLIDMLPPAPTTTGNYVLKCTVDADGNPTFEWHI